MKKLLASLAPLTVERRSLLAYANIGSSGSYLSRCVKMLSASLVPVVRSGLLYDLKSGDYADYNSSYSFLSRFVKKLSPS